MVAELVTVAGLSLIFYVVLRRFSGIKPPKNLTKPRSFTEMFAEGERLLSLRRFAEAKASFEKLHQRKPDYPKLLNRLGVVEMQMGNFQKAVEIFEQAVREKPKSAKRHANLGSAYLALKKYTLAKKEFEKALSLEPGNKKYQQLLKQVP